MNGQTRTRPQSEAITNRHPVRFAYEAHVAPHVTGCPGPGGHRQRELARECGPKIPGGLQ